MNRGIHVNAHISNERRMKSRSIRFTAIALAACFVWACGGQNSAALVASAKAYLGKGDFNSGIIQLKSALQATPDNAEARFLLGQAFLGTGSPAAAETELRKAIDLGYSADQAYPALARSLLAQGAFGRLTSELADRKLGSPAAQADLDASMAAAYLAAGDTKKANAAIAAATAAGPLDPRVHVIEAQIASEAGDPARALALLDSTLAKAPDYSEALVLKAQLQSAQGQRADAVKTLERAVDVHPNDIGARFALASMLIASGQADKATAQVDAMKKLAPAELRTLYADALISFARGDATHARDQLQQILAVRPDNLQALYLSGLVNFKLGSYATAEEALRRVITQAPGQEGPIQTLAAIYLRTGRPAQAADIAESALRRSPDHAALLRIAGEAQLALGNTALAARYYERANALEKGDLASQVRLAQLRGAAGETAQAFKDLAALSAADASSYQADIALIVARLSRGEFEQALTAIATLEKKQPDNPLTYNVKGVAYAGMHDLKRARQSFEKALEVGPGNALAARSLALLDVQEQKPDDARQRYEQMLAKDPKNEQLLLGLAEVLALTGRPPEEVKATIERAVAADPSSPRPRLVLVSYFMNVGDPKAALAAARSAEAALPTNAQVLEALGKVQRATGAPADAAQTFQRVVQLEPRNSTALVNLAEAQLDAKNFDAAITTLLEAISSDPNQAQPWVALVRTYFVSGRPDAAIDEARKLQKSYPDRAFGFALEGEVRAAQKKWPEAVTAYGEGLARQPIPLLAARRYAALESGGKSAEARRFAGDWMKTHPKDTTLYIYLGDQSLGKKDYAAALAQYQAALKIEPENPVLLNNVAFLLTRASDPAARDYAERAYRQAPFNPDVIDTLGWALVQTGDVKRGLELLRFASNLAPANAEIRLHLATALIKSGDKVAARRALEPLTRADTASSVRDDAEKLLSGL